MARGTVKWLNPDKGYGFIDPDDDQEEIFVHDSGIQGRGYRSLEAGQRVEYTPCPVPAGRRRPQCGRKAAPSSVRSADPGQ